MKKIGILLIITSMFLNTDRKIYAGTNDLEAVLKNSDGTSAFEVQDSAAKTLVRMQSDGKVGLGTTTPSVTLDVIGTATVSGGLNIGTTTSAITMHLSGSGLLNFGSIANNACSDKSFSLAGAVDGDTVSIGVSSAMAGTATPGLIFFGFVPENDSVSIRVCNVTGGSLTSGTGTVTVDIWKR